MLKNPRYVYGPTDPMIPGHLNFGQFILEKLYEHKNKIALINASTQESVMYSDIVQQAMNLAVSLTRMGVRKGDVIGLISENRNEYWGAVIGVVCTGASVALISPNYMQEELKNAMNIAKPKFIISSPNTYKTHSKRIHYFPYLEKVILFGTERYENTILYKDLIDLKNVVYEEFEVVTVDGQTDTLFVVYSSGTTGMPKGVMLTHLNVMLACSLPVTQMPGSMVLTISPWSHVLGLVGTLAGMVRGRTNVYLPKFNTEHFLNTIENYKIQQLSVVPPVLVAVSKWPGIHDLSSVQLIYSGAAPLSKETMSAVHKKFPNLEVLLQGYGASETTLATMKFLFSEIDVAKRKPGSVGKVVDGFIVKVVDTETREPLGPNNTGEICVKGSMLMKGYLGGEKGNDFDEEGFYKMGDIGYYDDDGYFYIVDRLKELIKYKGYQVPPAELESLLLTHPAVKDVGVIGIPQISTGEVPLAYIAIQDGLKVTEKELQDFVAERMSNPKHLRGGVRFVPQIPKSPSGKILRKELRQLYQASTSKL